jgi:TIR domain/SMODS-associated and fused to various effectors sensor domain
MVSYQSADAVSSVRLRDELRLRGFVVVHDRTSFRGGEHVGNQMADGVDTCDAFVAYITPSYLYETAPSGSPRPALDQEFIPVARRREREIAEAIRVGADPKTAGPVVYAVVRDLGDPHREAPERVRKATGIDISGWWAPVVDQSPDDLRREDAATVAGEILKAVIAHSVDAGHEELEISFVTRGTGQPPATVTIDATSLLGGEARRVGRSEDWGSVLAGLRDVEATLAAGGGVRSIRLRAAAHISAGILFGKVFHQAAGWRLIVGGRHGDVDGDVGDDDATNLRAVWIPGTASSDWLSVEIDMLGQPVSEMATEWIRTTATAPRGRLQISLVPGQHELEPEELAKLARATATEIRQRAAAERPKRIALMCASPIEFAVLVGHRLTAMWCALELLERGDDGYETVLTVPSDQ